MGTMFQKLWNLQSNHWPSQWPIPVCFSTISKGDVTFVATDDMELFITYQTLIKTKWAKCVTGQIWHTNSTDKQV